MVFVPDLVLFINSVLCGIILILGILTYAKKGEMSAILIGIAFGLFYDFSYLHAVRAWHGLGKRNDRCHDLPWVSPRHCSPLPVPEEGDKKKTGEKKLHSGKNHIALGLCIMVVPGRRTVGEVCSH